MRSIAEDASTGAASLFVTRCEAPPEPKYRLLSAAEIEEIAPPEYLIGEKITRGGLAVLAGPPGHGKTFLAGMWANSIATGVQACGDAVHQGPVVFIAAEGSVGLGSRLRAWKSANLITGLVDVHFLTEPIAISNPTEVLDFLRAIERMPKPPVLVVIDTLARCMEGDENGTRDMGDFIKGVDRIRNTTGAAVLILHHMNAGGERERGNTALRGACDTLMFVKAAGDRLTLTCEKQKDAAPFSKTHLCLRRVGESCVVSAAHETQESPSDLNPKRRQILELFRTHFPGDGARTKEWLDAANVPNRTFYDALSALVKGGYVIEPAKPRGLYFLSARGAALIGARCGSGADFDAAHQPNVGACGGGGL